MGFINSPGGKGGGARLSLLLFWLLALLAPVQGRRALPYGEADGLPPVQNAGSRNLSSRSLCLQPISSLRLCSFGGKLCCEMIPKHRKGTQSPPRTPMLLENIKDFLCLPGPSSSAAQLGCIKQSEPHRMVHGTVAL